MNYGAKATDNYDGISIPSLPPAIYQNFELSDFKVDTATKADGTQGKRIMTFLFTGPDNKGYQHTEWEVLETDKDAESKVDNMRNRIGHILKRFVPESVLKTNQSTSWETYTAWVNSVLGQTYKGIKLQIKIVGNVYQGTAKAGFPGYIPFVHRMDEAPLSFSAKEISANNEYYAHQEKKADTEAGSTQGVAGTPSGAAIDNDF